jgi:hypothetical protein
MTAALISLSQSFIRRNSFWWSAFSEAALSGLPRAASLLVLSIPAQKQRRGGKGNDDDDDDSAAENSKSSCDDSWLAQRSQPKGPACFS